MARAVELESPAKRGHFLRDFGQSDREVIENASSHASVPQALYMLNSPLDIAIHNVNSVLGRQLNNLESIEEKIDLIYRSMLTRKPTIREVERILSSMKLTGMKPPRIWFGLCSTLANLFLYNDKIRLQSSSIYGVSCRSLPWCFRN